MNCFEVKFDTRSYFGYFGIPQKAKFLPPYPLFFFSSFLRAAEPKGRNFVERERGGEGEGKENFGLVWKSKEKLDIFCHFLFVALLFPNFQ